MSFKNYLWLFVLTISVQASVDTCKIPESLLSGNSMLIEKASFSSSDLKRNASVLKSMCVYHVSFKEGKYLWNMTLVYNRNNKHKGPFWFLPHDDENTAFNSAVYATKKYGGGFLAIESHGGRYYKGQDPNRNFGDTVETARICSKQKYAAPRYSKNIFTIINAFKDKRIPYLAIHNNKNGWYGNGGTGGISIQKSSHSTKSYASGKVKVGHRKGIKDEDSLVYIAGINSLPNKSKLSSLIKNGMHVKYEIVNKHNNDCSMSNYVILKKGSDYYNIEAEHGDIVAQKQMVDSLMRIIKINPL